ncbi:hypothetical protein [Seonamhaeicola aphaedonensis]|uniref:Uncharacterized protein n=1 Tax=Seonamhaeicola aphaedonensis TaxID=1461338 RepID=A0A3D9HLG9_9FLAO|nr:hypothetical protein [Seonamhaeicola aphaedonensis]RED50352.1 hypothetical protein DFQ02_101381 [Seonamhaeicola aphaedonensis]
MQRLMFKTTKQMLFCTALGLLFLNTQCEEEDDLVGDANCDFATIVDASKYNNMNADDFTFINTEINGDCLELTIGASGCDGNSWEFGLIGSGAIAESFPEQRFLKLDFGNEELCLAYIERKVLFNLTPIQVEGSNKIVLHIERLNETLEYTY